MKSWKTLSTRPVYENPWIRLREDRVLRPDGNEGIYSVVSPRGLAVKVVALDAERRVHLVGQHRYPTDMLSWEIPGGAAKPAESALEAGMRELREEAGIAARSWRPLGGRLQPNNSIMDELGYLFLATDLTVLAGPEPDAEEAFVQRVVPFDEALRMVDDGEIEDAMTLLGLLWVERLGLARG